MDNISKGARRRCGKCNEYAGCSSLAWGQHGGVVRSTGQEQATHLRREKVSQLGLAVRRVAERT